MNMDSATKYVCDNCGGQLKSRKVIAVNGQLKGICGSINCVENGLGTVEKGVIVDVRDA